MSEVCHDMRNRVDILDEVTSHSQKVHQVATFEEIRKHQKRMAHRSLLVNNSVNGYEAKLKNNILSKLVSLSFSQKYFVS